MGILESMRKLISIGREASENIGRSFTELTGETTDVQFLGVRFIPLEFLVEQFDDRIYKVVRIDFEGILKGKSLMLLPEEDAVKLEKMLLIDILWDSLVNKSELPDYKEMEVSVMSEVANIVIASFLNVFANAFNSEINITTPEFIKDSGFSVVESLVVEMAEKIDIALIFDNKITILGKYPINCNVLILIDPETIEQLDNL